MRVVASWSGGKDSCFACYRAMLDGFEVSYLLNFVSKEGRCMSHGLDPKLMVAQSQAVGIPIFQREVTWDTYEEEFKVALTELKQTGIEGAVFGDIDLLEHKEWVTRVCNEVGITPIEPLWGLDPKRIISDFVNEGFEAIVINAKTNLFGKEWLGRKINRSFLKDLFELRKKRDFHICGEFGEYHTLVIDGPIFKRRIKILDSKKVLREGYWKHWLLDVSRYKLIGKDYVVGKK